MTSKVHLLFTLISALTVGAIAFHAGRFFGDSAEVAQVKGAYGLHRATVDLNELETAILIAERLVEPTDANISEIRVFLSARLDGIATRLESISPDEAGLVTSEKIEQAKHLAQQLKSGQERGSQTN